MGSSWSRSIKAARTVQVLGLPRAIHTQRRPWRINMKFVRPRAVAQGAFTVVFKSSCWRDPGSGLVETQKPRTRKQVTLVWIPWSLRHALVLSRRGSTARAPLRYQKIARCERYRTVSRELSRCLADVKGRIIHDPV